MFKRMEKTPNLLQNPLTLRIAMTKIITGRVSRSPQKARTRQHGRGDKPWASACANAGAEGRDEENKPKRRGSSSRDLAASPVTDGHAKPSGAGKAEALSHTYSGAIKKLLSWLPMSQCHRRHALGHVRRAARNSRNSYAASLRRKAPENDGEGRGW